MKRTPTEVATTDALEASGPHVAIRRARLQVVAGPDKDAHYVTRGERTTIGTHPSADFVLTDSTLSRFHCEIAIVDGAAQCRDLGSRNGTKLDGVSILAAPVFNGQTITLGKNRIHFSLEEQTARVALSPRERFGLLVGRSATMRAAFAILERAAQGDATVIIQGETGTGKDLAAESIHQESPRREGPFVALDCGALSPQLIESEMFGHERGAFTGAERKRIGALESASGGTLFLDEIGELSLDLQPKLLRALESREIRRVGGSESIPIDVRIIAATHRDLPREVNAKRFRADLYYRLAVVSLTLPPLRERLDDLPLLLEAVLDQRDLREKALPALSGSEFQNQLRGHLWPGNIREFRNYIERCVALSESLPPAEPRRDEGTSVDITLPLRQSRERWMRYFERRYLEALLAEHGQNVTKAAKAANIDRVYFYRMMTRCRLR